MQGLSSENYFNSQNWKYSVLQMHILQKGSLTFLQHVLLQIETPFFKDSINASLYLVA